MASPKTLCIRAAILLIGLVATPIHSLLGQAYNPGAAIASLREDIRILDERTRALTVEIEQLRRENAELRDLVARATDAKYVSLAQFNAAIAELDKAFRAGDRELAAQLTQQMERLAKQTQEALDTIARSAAATRGSAPKVTFTDDYPKTGITYTVQPGDTLSSIATRFNAQIRDIQNANRIADPRTLQVGQVLFIPQR